MPAVAGRSLWPVVERTQRLAWSVEDEQVPGLQRGGAGRGAQVAAIGPRHAEDDHALVAQRQLGQGVPGQPVPRLHGQLVHCVGPCELQQLPKVAL